MCSSTSWPRGGSPGILHHYTPTLTAFEFTHASTPQPHSLIFIGGLSDGLATTPYLSNLAAALEPTAWSLFTLTLTSSYTAWGLGHLDRDTDEIARCVQYVQDYKATKFGAGSRKVVLMGHSTGSQCVLHYLFRPNPHTSVCSFDPELQHVQRPAVNGVVLQAPVSDREAILSILEDGLGEKPSSVIRAAYEEGLSIAKAADPKDTSPYDTLLPLHLTAQIGYPPNTPISCRRFLSLASPESPGAPREDDLFSSDLSDAQLARTFGTVRQRGLLAGRMVVLYSGADQSVPGWVDKEKLLLRWMDAMERDGQGETWDREGSAVIPGASHALSDEDQAGPRAELVRRVARFLQVTERS